MSISLDISASGVVVFCTACESWTRAAGDPLEGHLIAENHERNVHPAAVAAAKSAHKYRHRHADEINTIR